MKYDFDRIIDRKGTNCLNFAMPRSILQDGFARMKKAIDAAR